MNKKKSKISVQNVDNDKEGEELKDLLGTNENSKDSSSKILVTNSDMGISKTSELKLDIDGS